MTGGLDALSSGPNSPQEGVSHAFPEGGLEAWACLLGSFLLMFPTFGFQTAGMDALAPSANIEDLIIDTLKLDRY